MLIDTHILLWFQLGDARLNPKDRARILEAHHIGQLYLSAISIWEIAMLQKQDKIALHQPIHAWIQNATQGIQVVPVSTAIALESVLLPHFSHKDPADRFIVATARILEVPLLTQDEKILAYQKMGFVSC